MIKPITEQECTQYLTEFFSPAASVALAAELFRREEEAGENYSLGASVCCEWEEFPSFQAAQAAVGGAYIPDGIHFPGGFLMRK
jgi:hypothetical protein